MPDYIRIGDAERDEAIAILQEHHAAGRLSTDEFDDRMGRALEAKVAPDLAVLFNDLPGRKPGQAAASAGPAAQPPGLPVQYGIPSALPEPVAKLGKPWYAQWWMVIVAMVLTGMSDGRLGGLVLLTALWVWVIYPQMVKRRTPVAPPAPRRPLTYEEREQIMYYIRTGSPAQAEARYRDLTGADQFTAKMTVAAMARELGR
ncbi:DUF1707 SHOCT-like domain-containing protein [Tessaracoccus palaemonis]|uniref:DUF1707 domain-containing protein n=1 Tax=Tessaracoccus palaemonis TaxID=2829499 RepID=A0ABX8SQ02_9ACTN|nr:DUF1707 domain-containing protein [Tessaracoccus palaemonis]QXT63284.1 DUF1707 domain-containing protein [Tessaracoccus palaemonis]